MRREKRRKCVHCGRAFAPDARNARHQHYCGAALCKAASKKASQSKWLAKPENRDYHRGPEAVARVRAWRAAHPGYSRRNPSSPETPEQEGLPSEPGAAGPTLAEVMASAKLSCNAPEALPAVPLQDH